MKKQEYLDYLEHDVYSIEEDNDGNKVIHIFGYAYYADSEIVPGKPYRFVEFCFCRGSLANFISDFNDYGTWETSCKQSIADLSEEECCELLEEYCKGTKWLPYRQLTLDTPCGDYIS